MSRTRTQAACEASVIAHLRPVTNQPGAFVPGWGSTRVRADGSIEPAYLNAPARLRQSDIDAARRNLEKGQ